MTIEAVCNQALDLIGYKRHIGNIAEGSVAARVALDQWQQTRDYFFHTLRPAWARRDGVLALMKSAPNIVNGTANYTVPWDGAIHPELPWLYEYQYPVDCVIPLQVKTRPAFLPEWRPTFRSYRLHFDPANNARTILCNDPDAIITYIAAVLDPDNWHNDFTEIIVDALAKKFAVELAPELARQKGQQQNANPPS
jgi:hypothetical protein